MIICLSRLWNHPRQKNKNFEKGKTVVINKYEMIPNGDSEDEFFVSEKAIVAMI